MIKKLFLTLIFITTISAGVAVYYYQQYLKFLNTPVFVEKTIVEIPKGQSFREFTQNILSNNGNGQDWQWRLFARMQKVDKWLKVGEFEIEDQQTPMQMMQKIKKNDVITYHFTIVEGMNWRELKNKLLDNAILIHTLNDISDEQLLQQLNSDKTSPEGLFLPETYQFIKGDSDFSLLKRANHDLNKTLRKHWHNKARNLPYTTDYEMLIMASIIEKETSLAEERETIAGVFVRRLQKNMRLQTDPTVIYGMGLNYTGDIRSKDLVTDTPYNTYTRKGLPPTPIAMASIESIAASANPQAGKSLYFVANNRGGHYFSDTYVQHQKAVKDYLKGKKL